MSSQIQSTQGSIHDFYSDDPASETLTQHERHALNAMTKFYIVDEFLTMACSDEEGGDDLWSRSRADATVILRDACRHMIHKVYTLYDVSTREGSDMAQEVAYQISDVLQSAVDQMTEKSVAEEMRGGTKYVTHQGIARQYRAHERMILAARHAREKAAAATITVDALAAGNECQSDAGVLTPPGTSSVSTIAGRDKGDGFDKELPHDAEGNGDSTTTTRDWKEGVKASLMKED